MRNASTRTPFVHEDSYACGSPVGLIHRSRLHALIQIIRDMRLPHDGHLGDFGCSNGFIIQKLIDHRLPGEDWSYTGFDYDDALLELGRNKRLPKTDFHQIDLNKVTDTGRYDLVICLETLEHVGDYKAAISTLKKASKPGGRVIISIPCENGLPGMIKFLGRRLLRGRNANGDFFLGKSEWDYVCCLLSNGDISRFRSESRPIWPQHLGFDLRRFEKVMMGKFRDDVLETTRRTFFGFNRFYVFRT